MPRTTRGRARCHPKTVEVTLRPASPQFGPADWVGAVESSCDSLMRAVELHAAGASRDEVIAALGSWSADRFDFIAELEQAAASGLTPRRLLEVIPQLRRRLASVNLSEEGGFRLRAPSRRSPGGGMDSREMILTLGLTPNLAEFAEVSGPEAFLAAAPTAGDFARLTTSVPEILERMDDMLSVRDDVEQIREDLLVEYRSGRITLQDLAERMRVATAEAGASRRQVEDETREAILRIPAAAAAHRELLGQLEYLETASDLYDLELEPLTMAETLPEEDQVFEAVSFPAARSLYVEAEGIDTYRQYVPDTDVPSWLSSAAASAAAAARGRLAAAFAAGEPQPARSELMAAAMAAVPEADLPAGAGTTVQRIAEETVACLQGFRLSAMRSYGSSPRYVLKKTGLDMTAPPFSCIPSGLSGHVELFLDRLQRPGMTGNAAASRRMAHLLVESVLEVGDHGVATAALVALSPHMSSEDLGSLSRALSFPEGWHVSVARELSARFSMPLAAAEERVLAFGKAVSEASSV